jgi:hypothetical protein
VRLQLFGSMRVLPDEVVSRLGQLEELGCTSVLSLSDQDRLGMLFPPAGVCQGGLPAVRAYFAAEAVDVELQGSGIRVEDIADLGAALAKVCVRSIDVSNNGSLGTSGAARLLEGLRRGVKSVSLKGTGLGLAAGQDKERKPVLCSGEDWARLEGALRGLSALEAIDLSDNAAMGTSRAARLLEGLGRGVKSVSLKGTGLGLAAGQDPAQEPVVCSDEDWARLEGALRGLSALEATDLSDNAAMGTSGVGRLVSCCAGAAFACVA